MKRALAIFLAVIVLATVAACSPAAKNPAIVGKWQLVDPDAEAEAEYGFGLEFLSDGTLRFGLSEELLAALDEDMTDAEVSEMMGGMDALFKMEYKILSTTEMEVTAKALMGLVSESDTITYTLNGDTLEFDGAVYTRVR
ncbi:MAG: hypothetical protein Q4B99_00525 [Clostridia bacterium]|nr:hypothetical protein [Clostridia bacterium]